MCFLLLFFKMCVCVCLCVWQKKLDGGLLPSIPFISQFLYFCSLTRLGVTPPVAPDHGGQRRRRRPQVLIIVKSPFDDSIC